MDRFSWPMRGLRAVGNSEGLWLPNFTLFVAFGLLDQLWLRVLRRTAPASADDASGHTIGLAVGSGPDFYVHPWQAVVHVFLLALCFAAFVRTIIRLRRKRR